MAFRNLGSLNDFVTFDTKELMVPVMIPQAAQPAVTGWNSVWLVAGAAALAWMLFGSKVGKAKKEETAAQKKKKAIKPFFSKKKVAKKTKRKAA